MVENEANHPPVNRVARRAVRAESAFSIRGDISLVRVSKGRHKSTEARQDIVWVLELLKEIPKREDY